MFLPHHWTTIVSSLHAKIQMMCATHNEILVVTSHNTLALSLSYTECLSRQAKTNTEGYISHPLGIPICLPQLRSLFGDGGLSFKINPIYISDPEREVSVTDIKTQLARIFASDFEGHTLEDCLQGSRILLEPCVQWS